MNHYVKISMADFIQACAARLRWWDHHGQLPKVKQNLWDEFLDYTESACHNAFHDATSWVDNWVVNAESFTRDDIAVRLGYTLADFDDIAWSNWCSAQKMSRSNGLYAFRYESI